ncbi:hypothetical protein GCM10023185_42920 [Hymenobacter saemangeumensis]|uniref:STAS domain-containing protein n=1 Tax=Hymenobacter saemangeumensis TaxID=1084522 RepID=A0ABP8IRU2_9BACT
MITSFQAFLPAAGSHSHIASLDLDAVDAVHMARGLRMNPQHSRPHFFIDCSSLSCQRNLGVSHVVSQLLLLHQAGASIWLRNVNAPLRHCLELLQLSQLFHVEAALEQA